MAKILKNDELNRLLTEYYDVMNISKEQKLERIELAEELFDVFFILLTFVEAQIMASVSVDIDTESMYEMFERRYRDACKDYGINMDKHPEIDDHISLISRSIVDSTIEQHEKKKRANSDKDMDSTTDNISKAESSEKKTQDKIEDRALSIAENESNSIFNRVEYDDAVDNGKTYKTWLTENDDRVRHTHRLLEMKTIPIDEPFVVGDSKMMFPRDTSMGASVREIVGCRCSLTYNKKLLDVEFEQNKQNMSAFKSKRNDLPISDKEFKTFEEYARKTLGFNGRIIKVDDQNTAYVDLFGNPSLYIGRDILPNPKPTKANEKISWRGALTHEIIGHYQGDVLGFRQSDKTLEEVQASIRASKLSPNLSEEERQDLWQDAMDRLHDNGIDYEDIKDLIHLEKLE